jgi:hypothetical protein
VRVTTAEATLDEALADGSVIAETFIAGRTAPSRVEPSPCSHDRELLTNCLVAFIKDDDGKTIEWQMRVRAQCADCDVPFVIAPTGRVPRDGGHGVVVALAPFVTEAPDLTTFITDSESREDPSCS